MEEEEEEEEEEEGADLKPSITSLPQQMIELNSYLLLKVCFVLPGPSLCVCVFVCVCVCVCVCVGRSRKYMHALCLFISFL